MSHKSEAGSFYWSKSQWTMHSWLGYGTNWKGVASRQLSGTIGQGIKAGSFSGPGISWQFYCKIG
jgi:hypothetical protein